MVGFYVFNCSKQSMRTDKKCPSLYSFLRVPLYFSAISLIFRSPKPWGEVVSGLVLCRAALFLKGSLLTVFSTRKIAKFSLW